ncbi:MAG: acyl-CoA dehydrogenase family protein [Solirubrobacteraceae bacterium]
MPLELSDEQQAFVDAIADFCARECGTREQRDALTDGGREPHSQSLYEKMAALGWIGVSTPEAFGGLGGGAVDMCLFLEHSQRGLAPIGGIAPTWIVGGAFERFGDAAQRKAVLEGIVAGRNQAIAMSEPEAGSDVGALTCRAEKVDGGWRINGQKTWISNAHISDHVLLVARSTPGGAKHEGLTMLDVEPAKVEGLDMRLIETMGGAEQNDMFFTDTFVPDAAVVGEVDGAWTQLMAGLNTERLILAALMLGRAQRAFDDTLGYVRERKQFGRPIGSFQTLKHRLADMATELECARLLVYDVAQRVDADPSAMLARESSMVKLKVTEVAKHVALEGMQMMGGYGYAREYDMEGHVRATIVSTIYGGTSEIQRDIIGRTLGL